MARLFAHFANAAVCSLRAKQAPLGEIQVCSPRFYIPDDQPGCGRDPAIERPRSFVRMTIPAGAVDNGFDIRRGARDKPKRGCRVRDGIGSPRLKELREKQSAEQRPKTDPRQPPEHRQSLTRRVLSAFVQSKPAKQVV
jgi:hypothetical protein